MKFRALCIVLLLIAWITATTAAQIRPSPSRTEPTASDPNRVRTEELNSRLMGRKMPYRVVLPTDYDKKAENGRRYPVIYLLHGLTGHFDNWTTKARLAEHAAG